MKHSLFLIAALAASPVLAPKHVTAEELPTLSEAIADFHRTEVAISGRFSHANAMRNLFFSDESGSYSAELAVDRDTRAQLMACGSEDRPRSCTIEANAELLINDGDVSLLIYQVHNLVVPE